MKSSVFVTSRRASFARLHAPVFCGLLAGAFLTLIQSAFAQTVQPQPTAASTPVVTPTAAPSPTPTATPSPAPSATPYPSPTATPGATPGDSPTPAPSATPVGGGSPSLTIVHGLPSTAEMEAYDTARTPQVSIALTAAATPSSGTSGTSTTSARTTSSLRPTVRGGVASSVTLQPAAQRKASGASTSSTASASQPVATVTLTYPGNAAGELVWVQMLRGGTLTATDGAGKVYDGSHGFFLTLGANGATTFSYQAPNASGTYQVLTRYSNVKTTLPFVVPDPAP